VTSIDDTGVVGLAGHYRSGATDPVAVTAGLLDRIAPGHAAPGALVVVDAEGATVAATASRARWRAGQSLSPLDGVPIAVKANIAVAGMPWTAGIAAYGDRVADRDAACVAHWRAQGAVILGLTNMDEGALGARGDNPWLGRCHNPHAQGFTPGGSSGGSAAAVAAGLCAAALGTDTIGSVRIPAAYCGVFGHKPRQALIDRSGVCPLSPAFDHVGVLARSAQDCAAMLGVRCEAGTGRIAVLDPAGYPGIVPEVAAAIMRVAADAEPVRLAFDFARIRRLLLIVAEVDGAAAHAAMLRDRPDGFSPGFARLLRWGAIEGQSRYQAALAEIAAAGRAAEAALADYDALLLPSTPHPAFAHDGPAPDDQADFMTLATAMGWPATAFPAGTSRGLPIGAQVVARDDATCLGLARACACA
jgi:aspartyl-tRNA(Asn)/glutamyl-tRNA(Gln) amidotransferase subunit A